MASGYATLHAASPLAAFASLGQAGSSSAPPPSLGQFGSASAINPVQDIMVRVLSLPFGEAQAALTALSMHFGITAPALGALGVAPALATPAAVPPPVSTSLPAPVADGLTSHEANARRAAVVTASRSLAARQAQTIGRGMPDPIAGGNSTVFFACHPTPWGQAPLMFIPPQSSRGPIPEAILLPVLAGVIPLQEIFKFSTRSINTGGMNLVPTISYSLGSDGTLAPSVSMDAKETKTKNLAEASIGLMVETLHNSVQFLDLFWYNQGGPMCRLASLLSQLEGLPSASVWSLLANHLAVCSATGRPLDDLDIGAMLVVKATTLAAVAVSSAAVPAARVARNPATLTASQRAEPCGKFAQNKPCANSPCPYGPVGHDSIGKAPRPPNAGRLRDQFRDSKPYQRRGY